MSARRRRLLAAGILPVVLLLPACGSSVTGGVAPATAAASSGTALDGVGVSAGAAGAAPALTLPSTPFTVPQAARRVVRPGTGATITDQQKLTVDYLLVNGRDGKARQTMWGPDAARMSLAQVPQFSALAGQKVGAQVLFAIPAAQAVGPAGEATLDIRASDTLLYLLQVTDAAAPLTQATGSPVAPRPGLPTVRMGATPKAPATFTIPRTDPPTETIAQPLVLGTGPEVMPGQTVRVTYTGVTWRDPATPFDHSGKTPAGYAEFPVGNGRLIKAWDEHLVGQRVGTRLLLVVPPKDGYGSAGSGQDIRGTDTLVFVLDVLDAG